MGTYVYKVTAERVTLSDGGKANVAVFAYKPWYSGFDADEVNRKMEWESRCHIAERYVRHSKNYTGRVVLDGNIERVATVNRGSFTDSWFDSVAKYISE